MDLRAFEMRARTANPVVGATVKLFAASPVHPNPGSTLDTTETDLNGMWEFTGLPSSLYDVKIEIPGESQAKWYKGEAQFSSYIDGLEYLTVVKARRHGALADGKNSVDGVIGTGSDEFSAAGAHFTADDVGKTFVLYAGGPAGVDLRTSIVSVESETEITLADDASATFTSPLAMATYAYWLTDDSRAINDAIETCGMMGGGIVSLDPSDTGNNGFVADDQIVCPHSSVYLQGAGKTQSLYGDSVRLLITHQIWPALHFDQAHYSGILDLALLFPGRPKNPAGSNTFQGDTSFGAMIALTNCGRFRIQNTVIPNSWSTLACGTVTNPIGSTRLEVFAGNEWWCERKCVEIRGAPYFDISGGQQWECRDSQDAESFAVIFSGPGHPTSGFSDGGFIRHVFAEDFGTFVRFNHTDSAIQSIVIEDNLSDGTGVAGIHVSPSGTDVNVRGEIRKLDIGFNRVTGIVGHPGIGVHLEHQNWAIIENVTISDIILDEMGSHGILVASPAANGTLGEIFLNSPRIHHPSFNSDNAADGIRIEANVDRIYVTNAQIYGKLTSPRMRYGFYMGAGCTNWRVEDVLAVNAQTANFFKGTLDNGTTKVWRNVGGDTSVPAACAYHDANQSIANTSVVTAALNQERWDTHDMHDLSTNNSRITCVVPGLYTLTAQVQIQANNTGFRSLRITVNGSVVAIANANAVVGEEQRMNLSRQWRLAAGDYVQMAIYQNSTIALNLESGANFTCDLSAVWIGG